MRSMALSLTAE